VAAATARSPVSVGTRRPKRRDRTDDWPHGIVDSGGSAGLEGCVVALVVGFVAVLAAGCRRALANGRRRFVTKERFSEASRTAPDVDLDRFRADLDDAFDQAPNDPYRR
jgi:hypothetical protein